MDFIITPGTRHITSNPVLVINEQNLFETYILLINRIRDADLTNLVQAEFDVDVDDVNSTRIDFSLPPMLNAPPQFVITYNPPPIPVLQPIYPLPAQAAQLNLNQKFCTICSLLVIDKGLKCSICDDAYHFACDSTISSSLLKKSVNFYTFVLKIHTLLSQIGRCTYFV